MADKCIYCKNELSNYNGYDVCQNCKAIRYTKKWTYEELKKIITDYLDAMKDAILKHQDELHAIDDKQNRTGISALTPNERTIYEKTNRFREIRMAVEEFFKNNPPLDYKDLNVLLYELLTMSAWLNEQYMEDKNGNIKM